jgi:hypothetical protein
MVKRKKTVHLRYSIWFLHKNKKKNCENYFYCLKNANTRQQAEEPELERSHILEHSRKN